MKFLETHTGAMVVLAVVIVLSVLLGSHLPGSRPGRRWRRSLRPSPVISRTAWDITANLLTVAGRYLDEGELGELTDSRAAFGGERRHHRGPRGV